MPTDDKILLIVDFAHIEARLVALALARGEPMVEYGDLDTTVRKVELDVETRPLRERPERTYNDPVRPWHRKKTRRRRK